jgi:hypothetical protein
MDLMKLTTRRIEYITAKNEINPSRNGLTNCPRKGSIKGQFAASFP